MPRYSEALLDEIRQANDIVDTISGYVKLTRKGRSYFGLCPFHNEKSPSFSVSQEKQIFHCFGCGVGGNVFSFIMKSENIGFGDAVRLLAERKNISLPVSENKEEAARDILKAKVMKVNEFTADFYHKRLYTDIAKQGQEYVKKRKLTNNILQAFRIGFSGTYNELYLALKEKGFDEKEILESGLVNKNEKGKYIDRYRNRLMFPICDERGRAIAFGGRVLDDSKPKYINSPENIVYSKGRHLYGLNVAKKGNIKEKLLIVEGYMDVISLHQRGITNTVAALGTALTSNQGNLIRRNTDKVLLSFDQDEAGQTAKLRAIEILQNMGADIRIIELEGAKDPDEYIIKFGEARFQNVIEKAKSVVEFKVNCLKKTLDLNNVSDKVKFLNEIAKILSKVQNNIEREVYIEKIAREYNVSKDAIISEVNKKIYYSNPKENRNLKFLEKGEDVSYNNTSIEISSADIKIENTLVYVLLTGEKDIFDKIKQKIELKEIKQIINKKVIENIYLEYEKGINGNVSVGNILDKLEVNEQGHLTKIMAIDYEISKENINQATEDLLKQYKLSKLGKRKEEIIKLCKDTNITQEDKFKLNKELGDIVMAIVKLNSKIK